MDPKKYSRALCLSMCWEGSRFVIENYLTGTAVETEPLLAQALHELVGPQSLKEIESVLRTYSVDASTLELLLDQNILLEVGGARWASDQDLFEAWEWGHYARAYHFMSSRYIHDSDDEAVQRMLLEKAETKTPPPIFKEPQQDIINADFDLRKSTPVEEVLLRRRSTRDYSGHEIEFSKISRVVALAMGQIGSFLHTVPKGLQMKTSPSAGARHPTEAYLVSLRVNGLPPGLYHFLANQWAFTCLKRGQFQKEIQSILSQQAYLRDCAAVIVLTSIVSRTMWKYTASRAYRMLFIDAGHIAQSIALLAAERDISSCVTAAFRDRDLQDFLDVNPFEEIPICTLALGLRDSTAE